MFSWIYISAFSSVCNQYRDKSFYWFSVQQILWKSPKSTKFVVLEKGALQ